MGENAGKEKRKGSGAIGIGLLLLALVFLLTECAFCFRFPQGKLNVSAGNVLTADVLIPYDGTDAYETDLLRQRARDDTPTVYTLDTVAVEAQQEALAAWFTGYDAFLKEMTELWEASARDYNGYLYNDTSWEELITEEALRQDLKKHGVGDEISASAARAILELYLPKSSLHALGQTPDTSPFAKAVETAVLSALNGGLREEDVSAARTEAKDSLKKQNFSTVLKSALGGALIDSFVTVSVKVDQKATEAQKAAAAAAVEPVTVSKGQVLFSAGRELSEADIAKLISFNLLGNGQTPALYYASLSLYPFLLFVVYAVYLIRFERQLVLDIKAMCSLCLLLFITIGLLWVFSELESRLAPVLLGVLLALSVHKKQTARGVNVLLSFIGGALLSKQGFWSGDALSLAAGILVMGEITVSFSGDLRHRTGALPGALCGGVLGGLIAALPALIGEEGYLAAFVDFGLFFAGAMIALLLSWGLLVVWDSLFGLPSAVRLNELMQPDNPLLRRLMTGAPGTYHHSLTVAQLGGNAAEAIGADALLVKAAALFHDVGKLRKPLYFAENLANAPNPHDELPPVESAALIIAHVADAEGIYQKYRIPEAVRSVAREHHGTTLTAYFYYKAQNGGSRKVSEIPFRYPGPKPSSRESAVLMLSDSCEAAVRSLGNATMQEVKDMVRRVIQEKLEDNQFSECPITLKEISRIEASFEQTFMGMLHDRVSYPGKGKKE